MSKKEAKGEIMWIDDEVVGYKCECGEEITVGIEDNEACPKCRRQYILQQVNIVYEIESDGRV